MKEYLTMKEASLLIGKTPKTIKNYIKKGIIKNYFLVDGKYGQEYQISVRDLEPLGISFLDVLKNDFSHRGKSRADRGTFPEKKVSLPGEYGSSGLDESSVHFDTHAFIARHEELTLALNAANDRITIMTEENSRLKQELEEKNMLIQVLMKKKKNL